MKRLTFFLVLMLCGSVFGQTPGHPYQYPDAINGLRYGLTGDSTDETTEMQAALRAMEANGLPLVLDSGKYLFTDTLNVRGIVYGSGSYIHFELDGSGTAGKEMTAFRMRNNSGLFDMEIDLDTADAGGWDDDSSSGEYGCAVTIGRYDNDTSASNVVLSNLTIHGPERMKGNAISILGQSHNILAENIDFVSMGDIKQGFLAHWGANGGAFPDTTEDTGTTWHPYNITLRNITVDSMPLCRDSSDITALYVSAAYNVTIDNVDIGVADHALVVTPGDYGFRYAGNIDSSAEGSAVEVTNVTIRESTEQGFFITGYAGIIGAKWPTGEDTSYFDVPVTLRNCQVWGDGTANGIIVSYSKHTLIDHCYVSSCEAGLSVGPRCKYLTIQNSVFTENDVEGIYLHHPDSLGPEYTTLINNHVYKNRQTSAGTKANILVSNARYTTLIGNRIGSESNETCFEGLRINSLGYAATVIGNHVVGLHDSGKISNANAHADGGAYTVTYDSTIAVWEGNVADTSLKYFSATSLGDALDGHRKAKWFLSRDDSMFFAGFPVIGLPSTAAEITTADDKILRLNAGDSTWQIEAAPGAAGGDGMKVDTGDASVQVVDVGDHVLQEGTGIQFDLDNDSITIRSTTATFTWADSSGEPRYWVDSATYATHALETDSAGKALQDDAGNVITSTYATLTALGKVTDDTASWIDGIALFDTNYVIVTVDIIAPDTVIINNDTITDFTGSGLAVSGGSLQVTGGGSGLWEYVYSTNPDSIKYASTEDIIYFIRDVTNDTTYIRGGTGALVIQGGTGTPTIDFGLATDLDSIRFDSILTDIRNVGSYMLTVGDTATGWYDLVRANLDTLYVGTPLLQDGSGDTAIVNISTVAPGRFLTGQADAHFGDSTSGMIELGMGRIGIHNDTTYNSGKLNLEKVMFFMNQNGGAGNFEFLFCETAANTIRMGIPKSGVGFGTWNVRSGFFAGPSIFHDSAAYGVYWGFDHLAMATAVDGADLGVQNNLQVLDTLFIGSGSGDGVDTIISTTLQSYLNEDDANVDTATWNAHPGSDGSSHTYIDQDVTSGSSPTFDATNITGLTTGSVEQVHVHVRAGTSTIGKGNPIYATSYNAGGWYVVEIADASDPAKMPALAVADVAITTSSTVDAVVGGRATAQNTDTITGGSINSPLYVASGGGLTVTKPTGTNLIQKVGFIGRDHATVGVMQVVGAGRTNDLPNVASAYFWLGNASAVATAVTMSSDATMDNAGAVTIGADKIDSANVAADELAETDVNWHYEWVPFDIVHGRRTVTDSITLTVPYCEGASCYLFADSTNEGSDFDTVAVSGMLGFDAALADSLVFVYKGDGGGVIDSVLLYGPDISGGVNNMDSLYYAVDVALNASSDTRVAYYINETANLTAGTRYCVKFVNTLGADNDFIKVAWAAMRVKR